eukprot:GILJ01004950.1.p2 GENE.GILJ01004950.1~~GILJ01004950.1.p2  ORF type:complete len:143 (+),score=12.90 GILJ01004950.1:28-429(+)
MERHPDNKEVVPGKVFVGGLFRDTSPDTLRQLFEPYGAITDVVVMFRRGFAFVTFANPSDAEKVIDRKDLIMLDGRPLEVKRSVPLGQVEHKNELIPGTIYESKKLFIGGLSHEATLGMCSSSCVCIFFFVRL